MPAWFLVPLQRAVNIHGEVILLYTLITHNIRTKFKNMSKREKKKESIDYFPVFFFSYILFVMPWKKRSRALTSGKSLNEFFSLQMFKCIVEALVQKDCIHVELFALDLFLKMILTLKQKPLTITLITR